MALVSNAAAPSNDPTEEDVAVTLKSNETYRGRARGTSALTAAAAGALAAGLVVSPSEGLPGVARVLGLLSITLLIVSTSAFVIASLVHAYSPEDDGRHLLARLVRPWRTTHFETPGVSNQGLVQRAGTAQRMSKRIRQFTDVGLWAAFFAVLFLISALASITIFASESVPVQVTRAGQGALFVPGCGPITGVIEGTMSRQALESDTATIRIAIDASQCAKKPDGQIGVYLDRASIAVISSRQSG